MNSRLLFTALVFVILLTGIVFSIAQIPISYVVTTDIPQESEQLIPTKLSVPLISKKKLLVNPFSHTIIQITGGDLFKEPEGVFIRYFTYDPYITKRRHVTEFDVIYVTTILGRETTIHYRTTYTEKIYFADPEKSPLVVGSLNVGNGKVDLFFLTQEEYNKYVRGDWFSVIHAKMNIYEEALITFVPPENIPREEPIYILLANKGGSFSEAELQLDVIWEVFEMRLYTMHIQTVTTQQANIGPLTVIGIPLILTSMILLGLLILTSRKPK